MDERPAGWQPDPTGRHEHRYWDGAAWTVHVSDAGIRSEEPVELVPPPPEDAPPSEAPPVVAEPPAVLHEPAVVAPTPVVEPIPAVPAEPVAPAPLSADTPRRGRRRLLTAVVVVLALAGAALAVVLTKDDDDASSGPVAAQIRATFDDVTQDQADCLADRVARVLSAKDLAGLALDKAAPGPAEEQALTAISGGLSACGAAQATPKPVEPAAGGGGTTTSTVDEATYRQQLASFYAGMLNATPDQAACVADAVIAAGKVAEKDGTPLPELSTYFAPCHIDASQVGPAATTTG